MAAAVLAAVSAGHLLVLGALVAFVARSRVGAAAALLAVLAVLVRWGGPSLSALGGGQAVLGPAVLVGSVAAGASALLAAVAIALLAPRSTPVVVALAVVSGAIAAGPELPHDVAVRVVGVAAGGGVAYAARWVPLRHFLAAALAAAALVLATVA